mmetsp:Transcript_16496/g.23293  ORF Transcript_16496/g.23293 Transcript_16496/m.23293 type:complete len:537 (+) Transcript_16496:3-1613(+)
MTPTEQSNVSKCRICNLSEPPCPLFPDLGDELRMEYLLSFGENHDKLSFWKCAIIHACTNASSLLITGEYISDRVKCCGSIPYTFKQSLKALQNDNNLVKVSWGEGRHRPNERRKLELASWLLKDLIFSPFCAAARILFNYHDDEFANNFDFMQMNNVIDQETLESIFLFKPLLENISNHLISCSSWLTELECVMLLPALGSVFTSYNEELVYFESKRIFGPSCSFVGFCARSIDDCKDPSVRKVLEKICNSKPEGCSELWLIIDDLIERKLAVKDGQIIKILKTGPKIDCKIESRNGKVYHIAPLISQFEKNVLKVRITANLLSFKLHQIEAKTEDCRSTALIAKQDGSVGNALFELKRMKINSDLAEKMRRSIFQLEMAVSKLEEMSLNKNVLEASKITALALKSFREEYNLSIDKVEEASDELEEEISFAEQIGSAMHQLEGRMADITTINDEELELELEVLMQEASPMDMAMAMLEEIKISGKISPWKSDFAGGKVKNKEMYDSGKISPAKMYDSGKNLPTESAEGNKPILL